MKTIQFYDHGLARMHQRGIQEEEARSIVQNPEIILPRKGKRRRLMGTIRGRRLNVVIEETDDTIWIVTSFWAEL